MYILQETKWEKSPVLTSIWTHNLLITSSELYHCAATTAKFRSVFDSRLFFCVRESLDIVSRSLIYRRKHFWRNFQIDLAKMRRRKMDWEQRAKKSFSFPQNEKRNRDGAKNTKRKCMGMRVCVRVSIYLCVCVCVYASICALSVCMRERDRERERPSVFLCPRDAVCLNQC